MQHRILLNLEYLKIFSHIHHRCDFPGDVNHGLLRPANQSTTLTSDYEANNGVDGDIGTIAMTENLETHPWWKVQLAKPVWVTRVEIISNTFNGAYIEVL